MAGFPIAWPVHREPLGFPMKTAVVGAPALPAAASSVGTAQTYGNGPGHGQGKHGQSVANGNWGNEYGGGHRTDRLHHQQQRSLAGIPGGRKNTSFPRGL